MPRFWPEPAFSHDAPRRTAIVLVNLGTPEAPTKVALRRYLKEFLSDPRVVEIPRALWWLILNGIILNTRPAKSAEKYATVWSAEGSPLKVHTERQVKLLKGRLGSEGHAQLVFAHAMRYGAPGIVEVLEQLKAQNCARILLVPLYPQYAASTTASVLDELARTMQHWRSVPEVRYVRSFHDDAAYIGALAASVREHWQTNGRGELLVMSFHGVPRYTLTKGDPYHCQCRATGRLLAEELGLTDAEHLVTFQSRFGRAEWLQPYTQPTLEKLAREGRQRVDVLCPGFVSDCLETLEEIAIECKSAFLRSGGREFHYIPCLNERADWIAALAAIATAHIGDWLALPADTQENARRRAERARALGAGR